MIMSRWIMYKPCVSLILLSVATWGLGCTSEKVRVSPEYPVFWNAEDFAVRGLYFRSDDPLSFGSSVVEVKRTVPALDVRLSLWNNTGKDILVSCNAEKLMQWKIVTLFHGKQSERARPLYPTSGASDLYNLLLSIAGEKGPYVLNRPILIHMSVRIPLILREEAEYSDIELAIPLKYYVLGCEVPAEMVVKRTMRVVYVN